MGINDAKNIGSLQFVFYQFEEKKGNVNNDSLFFIENQIESLEKIIYEATLTKKLIWLRKNK